MNNKISVTVLGFVFAAVGVIIFVINGALPILGWGIGCFFMSISTLLTHKWQGRVLQVIGVIVFLASCLYDMFSK